MQSRTAAPSLFRGGVNHRTSREVQCSHFFMICFSLGRIRDTVCVVFGSVAIL